MSDVMMKALQIQVESLTRQVEQLAPENERVRQLLTDFTERHMSDEARIAALEAESARLRAERDEAWIAGRDAAAHLFHADQLQVWSDEILGDLALTAGMSASSYDDKVAAHHAVWETLNEIANMARSLSPPAPAPWTPPAWADVIAERRRQVAVEGWTPEHDDQWDRDELSAAAACYAYFGWVRPSNGDAPTEWPWDRQWWKPKGRRRDLVKAAALLLAEIERLDRLPPAPEDAP